MSFEKYIENNFYDDIFNKLQSYVLSNKDSLDIKYSYFETIMHVEVEDFSIQNYIVDSKDKLKIIIDTNLLISGYTKGKNSIYETDSYNILFKGIVDFLIDSEISYFNIENIKEYNKNYSEKTTKYTKTFIPIISSKELDEIAEDILRKFYPKSLEMPMPLNIKEFVEKNKLNFKRCRINKK